VREEEGAWECARAGGGERDRHKQIGRQAEGKREHFRVRETS